MDKNGLSSFLLGLGVGVGIGMLFAPKSGQETRELIKNKAGEGSEFLKQKAGETGEFVKQKGSELKDSASTWVDKGKDAVTRQKDTLTDAVEAGKQAYRDAVSKIQTNFMWDDVFRISRGGSYLGQHHLREQAGIALPSIALPEDAGRGFNVYRRVRPAA